MSAIFTDSEYAIMQDCAEEIGKCAEKMEHIFCGNSRLQKFLREYFTGYNIRVIWPGNRPNSVELVVVKRSTYFEVWARDDNRTIGIPCEKIRHGYRQALNYILTGNL